jgi:hypothetical protein
MYSSFSPLSPLSTRRRDYAHAHSHTYTVAHGLFGARGTGTPQRRSVFASHICQQALSDGNMSMIVKRCRQLHTEPPAMNYNPQFSLNDKGNRFARTDLESSASLRSFSASLAKYGGTRHCSSWISMLLCWCFCIGVK